MAIEPDDTNTWTFRVFSDPVLDCVIPSSDAPMDEPPPSSFQVEQPRSPNPEFNSNAPINDNTSGYLAKLDKIPYASDPSAVEPFSDIVCEAQESNSNHRTVTSSPRSFEDLYANPNHAPSYEENDQNALCHAVCIITPPPAHAESETDILSHQYSVDFDTGISIASSLSSFLPDTVSSPHLTVSFSESNIPTDDNMPFSYARVSNPLDKVSDAAHVYPDEKLAHIDQVHTDGLEDRHNDRGSDTQNERGQKHSGSPVLLNAPEDSTLQGESFVVDIHMYISQDDTQIRASVEHVATEEHLVGSLSQEDSDQTDSSPTVYFFSPSSPPSSNPRLFTSSPASVQSPVTSPILSPKITCENISLDVDLLASAFTECETAQSHFPLDTTNSGRPELSIEPHTPSQISGIIPLQVDINISSLKHQRSDEDFQPDKFPKTEMTSHLPAPFRSTIASQRVQHKKLVSPFRSPIIQGPKPFTIQMKQEEIHSLSNIEKVEAIPSNAPTVKIRHRTLRAAAQFKSPLSIEAAATAPSSSVRLTPTIQFLERKVQTLKRAMKVTNTKDEEHLAVLVQQWIEAGREVAYELWLLVKDTADSEGVRFSKPGPKRGMMESWGWDDGNGPKKLGESWGWEEKPAQEDENSEASAFPSAEGGEEKFQPTIGTMLRQLGICPDTLGWNEEEGDFVDAC